MELTKKLTSTRHPRFTKLPQLPPVTISQSPLIIQPHHHPPTRRIFVSIPTHSRAPSCPNPYPRCVSTIHPDLPISHTEPSPLNKGLTFAPLCLPLNEFRVRRDMKPFVSIHSDSVLFSMGRTRHLPMIQESSSHSLSPPVPLLLDSCRRSSTLIFISTHRHEFNGLNVSTPLILTSHPLNVQSSAHSVVI